MPATYDTTGGGRRTNETLVPVTVGTGEVWDTTGFTKVAVFVSPEDGITMILLSACTVGVSISFEALDDFGTLWLVPRPLSCKICDTVLLLCGSSFWGDIFTLTSATEWGGNVEATGFCNNDTIVLGTFFWLWANACSQISKDRLKFTPSTVLSTLSIFKLAFCTGLTPCCGFANSFLVSPGIRTGDGGECPWALASKWAWSLAWASACCCCTVWTLALVSALIWARVLVCPWTLALAAWVWDLIWARVLVGDLITPDDGDTFKTTDLATFISLPGDWILCGDTCILCGDCCILCGGDCIRWGGDWTFCWGDWILCCITAGITLGTETRVLCSLLSLLCDFCSLAAWVWALIWASVRAWACAWACLWPCVSTIFCFLGGLLSIIISLDPTVELETLRFKFWWAAPRDVTEVTLFSSPLEVTVRVVCNFMSKPPDVVDDSFWITGNFTPLTPCIAWCTERCFNILETRGAFLACCFTNKLCGTGSGLLLLDFGISRALGTSVIVL